MSGDVLEVNPPALDGAATAFEHAAAGIAGLQAGAPLAEAAGAVPALQTAGACRRAEADVEALTSAVTTAVRGYGANLKRAAADYETGDRAGRQAIAKADLPGG